MACFIVPTVEAIAVTIARKVGGRKENTANSIKAEGSESSAESETKVPFARKLKWLTNMLWGGSVLLAFEHIWHGEIIPWFPFLTAAGNAENAAEMLREMATVGVSMAVLVTVVWVAMLAITAVLEKRKTPELSAEVKGI
ncbi:MAG: hypothetical protein LBL96_10530 [Clostridiales bacterium]|jgi:hypothetical protein|nr:hypothetical protein [Clostridiales bacterium]